MQERLVSHLMLGTAIIASVVLAHAQASGSVLGRVDAGPAYAQVVTPDGGTSDSGPWSTSPFVS